MVRGLPIIVLISDVLGNVTSTSIQDETTLYCKCGMDHSDPYNKQANTDCKTIQYDAESQGVEGYVNDNCVNPNVLFYTPRYKRTDDQFRSRIGDNFLVFF